MAKAHGLALIHIDPRRPLPKPELVTEDSAALQFADEYRGRLRYCHDTGSWFEWRDTVWQRNRTGIAFEWARALARNMSADASDKVKNIVGRSTFAAGVERYCRSDPAFAVTIEAWDGDAFLIGTPSGTVDLKTGALRPADPVDGITRQAAIGPSEKAECPRWLNFLDEATGGDGELIRFLQQWCGYSLTADTREHALIFVYGGGGNGKSVFLNTVTGILNDYAITAAMETFTASKNDKHPTDLAMLRGARLVTASETEEGKAWAESRIKQMTGGDPITARFMRQDFFTFTPAFKLTIIGNHKPVLKNVDDAAKRRFNIVPFTRKPAKPDRELEAKLREEWPGIFRWMIDGCLDWQANGLTRPASVAEATASYFSDQDIFSQWLEDECDVEPDNPHKWETTSELYASWTIYAKNAGEEPGTVKAFNPNMMRKGLQPRRTNTARGFAGVRLKPRETYGSDR